MKDLAVVETILWNDVKQVGCSYLRDLPDATIPEDAGPPPQP
jgi:hypothetical protein